MFVAVGLLQLTFISHKNISSQEKSENFLSICKFRYTKINVLVFYKSSLTDEKYTRLKFENKELLTDLSKTFFNYKCLLTKLSFECINKFTCILSLTWVYKYCASSLTLYKCKLILFKCSKKLILSCHYTSWRSK